jgi:toxin YoeB
MNIEFTPEAWNHFASFLESDRAAVEKIKAILKDIKRDPFQGIGKPEPLKHDLKGLWSRRINNEHRMVYKIEGEKGVNQKCLIVSCRHHYD